MGSLWLNSGNVLKPVSPSWYTLLEQFTGLTFSSAQKPYVILAAGQSNMLGSADPSEGDHTVGANILIWNGDGVTTLGTALITPVYGSIPFNTNGSVNAAISFANALRSSGKIPASRPIWIIPSWFGGMPIEMWTSISTPASTFTAGGTSTSVWANLVASLASAGVTQINHVMWMQGEANYGGGAPYVTTLAGYAAQFATWYGLLQSLSQWTPSTTMTMSELGLWAANTEPDRTDFVRLLSSLDYPLVGGVSANGLVETSLTVASHAHFSGAGLITLGTRHFGESQSLSMNIGKERAPHTLASPRAEIAVSGTYAISYDEIRNGGTYVLTNNTTFQFPDARLFSPKSVDVIVDNSGNFTLTIGSARSNMDIGGGNTIAANATIVVVSTRSVWAWQSNSANNFWRLRTTSAGGPMFYLQNIVGTFSAGLSQMGMSLWQLISGSAFTLLNYNSVRGAWSDFTSRMGWGQSFTIGVASPYTLNPVTTQIIRAGTGYVPNEAVTLAGGTGTAATFTILATQVVSATIAAAGSGGTNGTQTITGTTGTGTLFTASVTVSGGAITAVLSIVTGGAYTVNPTSLTQEPVTGASLAGAKLNVVMGGQALNVSGSATVGSYTVAPAQPGTQASTSGAGTGIQFNLGYNNLIYGPHPQRARASVAVNRPNWRGRMLADPFNWKYQEDVWHQNTIIPMSVGSTITSSTMTQDQMVAGDIYTVATSAALVLPLAEVCLAGETGFYAPGGCTLTASGSNVIISNNSSVPAGTTVTVPILAWVRCVGTIGWEVRGAT